MADGGDGWVLGNGSPIPLGLQLTAGQRYDEFKVRGMRFEGPATGDPDQRVAEQDLDGTDAEVLFCSVTAAVLPKLEAAVAVPVVQAYNDWVSEYCGAHPDRLFGLAVIPPTGVDDAVAELRRVVGKPGVRGVQLLRFPAGDNFATYADEAFWAMAQDLDVTVVAHHNFGGEDKSPALIKEIDDDSMPLEMEGSVDLSSFAWLLTCDLPMPTLPIFTVEQLFLGGVLDRYPRLRFHFAETGIGWLPYWLEQMEDRYDRHRFWAGVRLERRPAEYVREHFTFSFQEDHAGVALRHQIGIDCLCWASDFPHSVSDWPWSRETRARQFAGLPNDEVRRIQALNIACQLRVITPAERDKLAASPLSEPLSRDVPSRGDRRMTASV
jgi:predicted TIM-barrel fold metal-dependent hydrolase